MENASARGCLVPLVPNTPGSAVQDPAFGSLRFPRSRWGFTDGKAERCCRAPRGSPALPRAPAPPAGGSAGSGAAGTGSLSPAQRAQLPAGARQPRTAPCHKGSRFSSVTGWRLRELGSPLTSTALWGLLKPLPCSKRQLSTFLCLISSRFLVFL